MVNKFKTVDEYINSYSEEIREKLKLLRTTIKKVVPNAEENFSYGVPAFILNGNLVLYAAFKTHIGFYPQPSAMKKFKKELSKYSTSEGTVRFPTDKTLPLDLISKIVKFRVRENQNRF